MDLDHAFAHAWRDMLLLPHVVLSRCLNATGSRRIDNVTRRQYQRNHSHAVTPVPTYTPAF